MTLGFLILYAHNIYNLFWTTFIYHDVNESIVGLVLGAITSYLLYYSDLIKLNLTTIIADKIGYREELEEVIVKYD